MTFLRDFPEICRENEPLAEHTWYRLGGPARWFFTPRDESELAAVVSKCREQSVSWRVLGRGANLLVRDDGFDGAVITLAGDFWERVEFAAESEDGDVGSPTRDHAVASIAARIRVVAGAGADFPRLVKKSADRGFSGLENLAGIPGSLGGIIRMNAGGKYGSISQYVDDVRVLERSGEICTRSNAEVGFRYRHTDLEGAIVLSATLHLDASDAAQTVARFRTIWNEKAASQPAVSEHSCGCIFKNPSKTASELSAGALIDRAGLKRTRIGGAEISERHANFIVARSGATAKDVLDLIELAKDRVHSQFGVALETEVEIW